MRLLTEVDAAGEAVEGTHALVYPLCMFLLLELGIHTEYLLKMRLLAEVDTTGEAVEGTACPCVSAGACSCCWNYESVQNTY